MKVCFGNSCRNLMEREQRVTGNTDFADILSQKARTSSGKAGTAADLFRTKTEIPYLTYGNYSSKRSDINAETENYEISQDKESGTITVYDKKAETKIVVRSAEDLVVQKDMETGTKVLIRDFGNGFYTVVRVTDELEGALKQALDTDVLREKELTGFKIHTDQKTGIRYITANGYEGRGGLLLMDDAGRAKLMNLAEKYMSQYPQLVDSIDEAIMFAAFEVCGIARRTENGIVSLGPNSLSFYHKNGIDSWKILFDEKKYELFRQIWDRKKNDAAADVERKEYWEAR